MKRPLKSAMQIKNQGFIACFICGHWDCRKAKEQLLWEAVCIFPQLFSEVSVFHFLVDVDEILMITES